MGNPVTYFEIAAKNGKELCGFYSAVFGWKIEQLPGGDYGIDSQSEDGIAGHIFVLPEFFDFTNQVTFYVKVDDIQAYLNKVETLGGQTLIPPQQIPGNRGSFAWFADPSGNCLGLYKQPESNE
jgi:predicted enzyme related to lactoylglutathione lyase